MVLCFSAGAVLGLLPGGAKIATGNYARHSLNCNLTKSGRGSVHTEKGVLFRKFVETPSRWAPDEKRVVD